MPKLPTKPLANAIRPTITVLRQTLRDPPKAMKAALDVTTALRKYGPAIYAGVKTAKEQWQSFQQFKASTHAPSAHQPPEIQYACAECVKSLHSIAREKWCIARLGESCFVCHRKVDAFGHPLQP